MAGLRPARPWASSQPNASARPATPAGRLLTLGGPLSALVLVSGAWATGAPARPRPACPGASEKPGRASARALTTATVCLLNRARRRRGLGPLRVDERLARAATAHAGDMAAHRYLSHSSRGGRDPAQRMLHDGYRCRTRRCSLGENIAWAPGRATPRAMVGAWMASPEHRANILYPGFRAVGAGIAPTRRGPAFYVTDFGG